MARIDAFLDLVVKKKDPNNKEQGVLDSLSEESLEKFRNLFGHIDSIERDEDVLAFRPGA